MTPLVDIVARNIAPAILERVVHDQNLTDEATRVGLFKSLDKPWIEVCRKIVTAYGGQVSRLAQGLYEQVYLSDSETAMLLAPHFNADATRWQAFLVSRHATLPLSQLAQYASEVKGQICLIVASRTGKTEIGTGFLIASDLVLTCRHVFRHFADDADVLTDGCHVECYFDFTDGAPVASFGTIPPGARKVGLKNPWRVASCLETAPDGLLDDPLKPEDHTRISTAFDFIVLQLDEPIGLQPVERGGGRRRSWISFPANSIPRQLATDDWIIIPQHPGGFPQRIDLGRFLKFDQTLTRIRYRTNTAPGSSGAPCFNQEFKLVGIHNAFVGPEASPLANQAIRIDHVIEDIARQAGTDVTSWISARCPAPHHVLRWSVARDNEQPRVILGREDLLKWLKASAVANPAKLADRVYVAQATEPGAGCTFSVDVMLAEIRGTTIPRAIYGSGGQLLPETVDDFLRSLLRELQINAAEVSPIPPRPGPPVPASPAVGEVDKLDGWLSKELPAWLGGVIQSQSELLIDGREQARKLREQLRQQGFEIPKEMDTKADSPEAIMERAIKWDVAYVVIDELRPDAYTGKAARTSLKGEVYNLVAALVQGQPESSLHPGLRKLRWLFLGRLPDFIPPGDNGATLEKLDPQKVGAAEFVQVIERMESAEFPLDAGRLKVIKATAPLLVDLVVSSSDKRLVELQRVSSQWCQNLRTEK